jgi:hypothetical protein
MKKITLLLLILFSSISGYSQLTLEGFENTTGPDAFPSTNWTLGTGNWAVFDNGISGTTTNVQWDINSAITTPVSVYQGVNSAYVNIENVGAGNTSEEYLATPPVLIPANGVLNFYTRMNTSGNQGTIYQIRVAPATASQTDTFAYSLVQQWTENELIVPTSNFDIFTEKTVDLSTYANQFVYVSFVKIFTQTGTGTGGDTWYIDNVSIDSPCLTPTGLTVSLITSNSASLNWVNPNGSGSASYEIEVVLASGTPTGIPTNTTSTFPYVVTGLLPNTAYKFYVRARCTTGFASPWSVASANFTTNVAPPICGGNFVDSGGTTGNYGNNAVNLTTVICPTVISGPDAVTVTFTAFNTQAATDILTVFDGDTNTATLLASLSGTTLPPSFTSSHPTGCLTFVFNSNATTNAAGWLANVTCAPKPVCSAPTALTTPTFTHNSATFSWTQPANPDTSVSSAWQVVALPCGSPAPVGTPATGVFFNNVTSNPFTLTGLIPLTCYDIYVRSACGSTWSGPRTITTLAAPPECGGNFVDAGGTTGNYAANSNVTTIICPTNPGEVVTVTFTAFDTEATWDGLYVYNGTGIVPANIIASANGAGNVPGGIPGSYWGNAIPGPFTSSAADGCLTFVFRSDGTAQNPGWVANVTCAPPPTCRRPTTITTNTVTSNSAILNWVQPTNPDGSVASSWQIVALPCASPAPVGDPTTGLIFNNVTSNPFTLTGLSPATCYTIYIRAICSTTDASTWANAANITTLVAPPVCGGNFVDAGGTGANYAANSNVTTIICPTNPGEIVTVTFTAFDTEATWDGLYVYDGTGIVPANIIASANGAANVPGGIPGSYWGNTIPGPFTSTAADGCLTFVFRSDGAVQNPGWVANVTCSPAPTCLRPSTITATPITQTSAVLNWVQLPNPNGSTATAWEVLVLPAGSPVPTGPGIPVTSLPYNVNGLTPGTAYVFYVRAICSSSDASQWSAYNFATLPLNDECVNATFAIVNQNLNCVQTTPGTLAGATASLPTSTCGGAGAANDDVWFTFTATTVTHVISFTNVTPATALSYAIYQGTCTGLTEVGCNTGAGLVAGTTYYIRVFSTGTVPVFTNFNLCIGTLPCTEAPAFCTGQTVTYANATNVPSLGQIGCLFTSPNPAFFFLQVNQAGPLSYLISQVNNAGVGIDVDYVAWGPFTDLNAACTGVPANPLAQTVPIPTPLTGCPGTLHACSYSIAPQEIMCIPNAQLCDVYVIMITNFANQPGTVTFTQTNSGGGTTACFPINTFNYSQTNYCQNQPNPTPVLAPSATAGVYTSTPGLVIDSVTGTIDLLASTPGAYVVTSTSATTIGGVCSTIPFITTTRTVIITAPANATISYPSATYCNNITSAQGIIRTGTAGGTYSSTPAGLLINAITGEIIPVASAAGVYTVTYTIAATGGCPAYTTTTQVEILVSPIIIQPSVTACDAFTLTTLAVGNYFAAAGGVGTPLDISIPLTSSQPVYIYAVGTNGCVTEKSFNVTINTVPTPTFTVIPSSCTSPTGSLTVNSPVSAGSPPAPNLFISEVTDANTGSLTYIELYNGTGSPVNLANYKLRTFNNGSTTFTAGCDNILSGTLNNNSTYVISVGSATNAGGVIPNQVFASCSGVNTDDCIKLMDLTNTVIDSWGRTDGVSFTPLNQPGYTYRRLNTATVPSTTWNATDWTAIDPEDYTNVGSYTYSAVSNYQYSVDNGVTYQAGLTFNNLAAGNYILIVKDLITGCLSAPVTIVIDPVNPTPSVTTFTYVSPVCQNASSNPIPDTSATGFTTGGIFTSNPATGININPTTGEINLAGTLAGTYDITYTFAFNPTTCQSFSATTSTIVITNIITPVLGFSYSTPICQNAQATLSPTLVTGFTTGGTFNSTTGLSIDATSGVIDLTTSTAGSYTITYTVAGNSCQASTSATFNISINPVITPVTTFNYVTPVCQNSTTNPIPNTSAAGFTTGGTYSSNPSTGIDINPTTGEIILANTTSGTYVITYTVAANSSTCQITRSTDFTIVINAIVNPVLGFSYTTPICQNAQANLSPTLVTGFTTGGTFSSTTGLSINGTTGVIDLATSTSGNYTITYTSNPNVPSCLVGGTNTFSLVINTVITPVTGFSYNTPFCSSDSVTLQLPTLTAGFTAGGTFSSTSGLSLDGTTGEINIPNSTPGVYTITYAIAANAATCQVTGTNSTQVMIIPPVTIELNGGCQSANYILTATPVNDSFVPETASYSWQNAAGIVVGTTQSITVTEIGIYTVTITVDGCSTESLPFDVTSVFCVIQKGISVNNYDLNDTFDLTGFDVKKLTIFNRLGMKVYSLNNYVDEWGGKSDDGDELPDGTYYYVIEQRSGTVKTGWIYINRAQ